jgi:GTP diphosphokinase / guanosine-3',5'-bis(diphosphate) 3'-diphosphatase
MFFSDLKNRIKDDIHFDLDRVQKAYNFAKKVHIHQKRKTGEPFIIHPVEVATTLYKIGGSEDMIIAALLHDVIEDSENKEEVENEIHKTFGNDIFFLVQAVSKNCNLTDKAVQQKEYFDQIEEALKMDVSIFFLKVADLIHNMKTLASLSPNKQEKWINELKDTYIPLMSEHFHQISLGYQEMYSNLMNELESVIENYEQQKSSNKS